MQCTENVYYGSTLDRILNSLIVKKKPSDLNHTKTLEYAITNNQ